MIKYFSPDKRFIFVQIMERQQARLPGLRSVRGQDGTNPSHG